MRGHFSPNPSAPHQRRWQRCFEIVPGAISWSILVGMVLLTFWKPLAAAVLIIAFDLYWLLRLLYMTIFLVLSYLWLAVERSTDWMARLRELDGVLGNGAVGAMPLRWPQRLSAWRHHRALDASQRHGSSIRSDEIYHLVIIPVAKETREVIEPGLQSLAHQQFPSSRILLVLALESRASDAVKEGVQQLQRAYRRHFLDLLVITHPDGLPGEARVKGANATYAARAAADFFAARDVAFDAVIASCFDADTVVNPDYCACLAYHFMTCPDRTRASFQPIPVYHNNIWQAPAFSRVLETGASFFQMIEATNPEHLVTFSSHSMSFRALVDAGYWPVDMISDDSAIFWKALLRFDGDYRVVPMYVTLSMDAVSAGSWWRTIRSVYRQKRRWAWGVENFPVVMRGFQRNRHIPWTRKLRHGFKLLETHVSWATSAFLLTVIGWLPALFAGREFSSSVFYYSAPRVTGVIFGLSSLALVISIVLSLGLLPPPPVRYPLLRRMGVAVEWLLVPLVATFLSALPALDAQTRLMLGRRMEFQVTEKTRQA